MSDPAYLLADAACEWLNDEAREYSRPPFAIVPDDPAEELLREVAGVRTLVIPVGETEQPSARTLTQVVRTLQLIVQAPLDGPASVRDYAALVHAMRLSLRHTEFAGHQWQAIETLTRLDPDRLREADLFVSTFSADYATIEEDC